eukprot:gene28762-37102_t
MRVLDKSKIIFARRLRSEMTPPESRIWARLRVRDKDGLNFRRQHPKGPYVLDFYCARARLAIEVDGLVHATGDQPKRDAIRDAWLLEQDITTYRIPASEIMADPDEVALGIWSLARDRVGGL